MPNSQLLKHFINDACWVDVLYGAFLPSNYMHCAEEIADCE